MTNPHEIIAEEYNHANKHLPAHEPDGYDSSSTCTVSSADLDGHASTKQVSTIKSKKRRKTAGNGSFEPTENSISHETPIVDGPGKHDVLCGRGRGKFYHFGNRRMLQIVEKTKPRYRTATKSGKTRIVDEVCEAIESNGGRFLKKCDKGWYEVSTLEKHRKVCHCLREEKNERAGGDYKVSSGNKKLKIQRKKDKKDSSISMKPENLPGKNPTSRAAEIWGELGILGMATAIQHRKDAAGDASSIKETEQTTKPSANLYLNPRGDSDRLQGTSLLGRLSHSRHSVDFMAGQQATNPLGLGFYDPFAMRQLGSHQVGLTPPTGMIMGEPRSVDVLIGRDPSFYFHMGNTRLRNLIQNSVGFPPSTSEKKRLLTRGIISELKLAGGRFLIRQRLGIPAVWKQINDREAEELIFGSLGEEEEKVYQFRLLQTPGPSRLPGNLVHTSQGLNQIADISGEPTRKDSCSSETSTLPSRKKNESSDETTGCERDGHGHGDENEDEGKASIPENWGKQITPNDVICGRGRGSFGHPGNRRLLRLFWDVKDMYRAANTSKKAAIGRMILQDVASRGGRFLKRTDDGWSEVADQVAMRKVCNGIRDIPGDPEKMKRSVIADDSNESLGLAELLPKSGPSARRDKNTGASTISAQISLESQDHILSPRILGDNKDDKEGDEYLILHPAKESLKPMGSSKKKKIKHKEEAVGAIDTDLLVARSSPPGTIIKDPTENDILCGRGRGYFGHTGNRRMWEIIRDNSGRYKLGTKFVKGQIARDILFEIQSNGARFLKRKEGGKSLWEVCPVNDALLKVSHGIRDAIRDDSLKTNLEGKKVEKGRKAVSSSGIDEGTRIHKSRALGASTGLPIEEISPELIPAELLAMGEQERRLYRFL